MQPIHIHMEPSYDNLIYEEPSYDNRNNLIEKTLDLTSISLKWDFFLSRIHRNIGYVFYIKNGFLEIIGYICSTTSDILIQINKPGSKK